MHKPNQAVLANRILALSIAVLFIALFGLNTPSIAKDKPIDWDKRLVKARQLMDTNNVEEAEKIYDNELKKHPESGAVRTDLGKCYKKRGHQAQAKASFKRATEVEPAYAEAYYELGAMQESDKEYELAVASYEHFLQLAPYADRRESVKDRINFCKGNL